PAQSVTGTRRSNRETRKADQNRDYQQTLDEDDARKRRRQAELEHPENPENPEHLEIPGAFPAFSDPEEIFFAGVANTGPTNEDLPKDLKEAFARSDAHLWR
ncbi:hypothetical protein BV22DRAFT_979722, partial [Leucogyrophana mollusca]